MRKGDVYTCFFSNAGDTQLKIGKRVLIVLEEKADTVVGVTLTMKVGAFREDSKVYSSLTINGKRADVCIFADLPLEIEKGWLIEKKAEIASDVIAQIEAISCRYQNTKLMPVTASISNATDVDNGLLIKNDEEIISILHSMSSKKTVWKERMIGFVMGIVASVIASFIFTWLC